VERLCIAAVGLFFMNRFWAALFLAYVIFCVAACFFPQTCFLGPVIHRGRREKIKSLCLLTTVRSG
jgi:hypothetical protein